LDVGSTYVVRLEAVDRRIAKLNDVDEGVVIATAEVTFRVK